MNQLARREIQHHEPHTTRSMQPYFPNESDWKMMLSWGAAAIRSGMLPSAIKSPEAAAIIALKGRELGIPFMVAVAHIHIINGKPCMSAEMQQTLAMRNIPGLVINILEMTNEKATVEIIRPEKGQEPFVLSWTLEDARKADLLGKSTWRQYPRAMLFSRAVSAALRAKCAEALMGISYTPEELGANVDEDGNVIETKVVSNDSDPNPEPKEIAPIAQVVPQHHLSEGQLKRLFALAKDANLINKAMLKPWIISKFGMPEDFSINDINQAQYQEICNALEDKAKGAVKPEAPVVKEVLPWQRPDFGVIK